MDIHKAFPYKIDCAVKYDLARFSCTLRAQERNNIDIQAVFSFSKYTYIDLLFKH